MKHNEVKKMTREQLEHAVDRLQRENENLQRATRSYTMIVRKNRVVPKHRKTKADLLSNVLYMERLIKDKS